MKICFLGTCAADYAPDIAEKAAGCFSLTYARPSALLIDDCLMVDCGPYALDSLSIAGKRLDAITDLLITHSHFDHFDMESVRTLAAVKRKEPLRIWCDEVVASFLDGIAGLVVNCLKHGVQKRIDPYLVLPLNANHVTEHAAEKPLHYLIERDGKKLFYGCDGGWLLADTFQRLYDQQIDFFIFDCTVGDMEGAPHIASHNSIPMIRMLLKSMRPLHMLADNGKVIASHFSRNLHGNYQERAEILSREGIDAAYDGWEVEC